MNIRVPCGRTDRRDEAFRNFTNSPEKKRKRKGGKKEVIMCLILFSFFAVKYTGYLWPLHQVIFKIYDVSHLVVYTVQKKANILPSKVAKYPLNNQLHVPLLLLLPPLFNQILKVAFVQCR